MANLLGTTTKDFLIWLWVWFGLIWMFIWVSLHLFAEKTREKLNEMSNWWDVNGCCCKCWSSSTKLLKMGL